MQDDVEPFSYEEVDQIVSNEIGVRISKAFAEFVEKLPHRVNNILDIIGNNELEVKVDAIDEKTLMVGFQKIANRITMGLVLAALIVGASMLMRVETSFRLFGYPGLPLIFFIAAALGGVLMIFTILLNDRKDNTDN